MKKIIYLLAVGVFAFSSCSKKDGSSELPRPEEPSKDLPVPENFGRKILIEEFTAAWCGYCPRGNYYYDSLNLVYPGKLVGVSIHVGDVMDAPEITNGVNVLDTFFNAGPSAGYPNSVTDRGPLSDPSSWPGILPMETGLVARCGFNIDASTISGHTLSLTVHTGFAANMYGDYRLNVYIVEADVHSSTDPGYDQHNYYSSTSTAPDPSYPNLYNNTDPIVDFHHGNVLRKVVTTVPFGDVIPQDKMIKKNDYKKTFSVDLTGLNYTNCYVVAFLDKYGTAPLEHQVQNVQRVKIGSMSGWN